MWNAENRACCDRSRRRYPSNLTDAEWAMVVPLIPLAKRDGNKRTANLREVVNGRMCILSTGCQWAAMPRDLASRGTVRDYFARPNWEGTLRRIHHALFLSQTLIIPRPMMCPKS
jgi:transposase